MREITPINNNGSIQLKFSVAGRRYSFNPIPGGDFGNKRDMASASAIATRMHNDILAGCFDTTLEKYRLVPKTTHKKPDIRSLLDLWDIWVGTLDLSAATKANHYNWIRRMIIKANPDLGDTTWLTKAKLSTVTYNNRLSYLKNCLKWAVTEGLVEVNPYQSLKARKVITKEVKPFTLEELKKITLEFETLAPHYAPFVRFLFLTGVRLSEAIGLRWGHIDFDRGEIVIRESLSKDVLGNGYSRVRKETKTGSIRYLLMGSELRGLLLSIQPSIADPDRLVFTTPRGCIIDADNFRDRLWRSALESAKVPYRKPHTARHTMLSYAVEQGTPLTGVAYLAGHKNTRMVIQTYGHLVNRPSLPLMPL